LGIGGTFFHYLDADSSGGFCETGRKIQKRNLFSLADDITQPDLNPMMIVHRNGTAVLRCTATTLLLVGAWIASVVSASASCGDYLHRRNAVSHERASADLTIEQMEGLPFDLRLPSSESPTKPCSGPGCRRMPASSPLPLGSTNPATQMNDWLLAMDMQASPVTPLGRRIPDCSDVPPLSLFSPRIDIPPELA